MADWFNTDDGRNRVRELLRLSGTPLEIQVARQCRAFCREHDGEYDARITTKRIIYGGRFNSQANREVDQSVQFDTSVELTDDVGVRLRLRVPVESKYRKGLMVFGFPRPKDERVATLPMVSDFAGAILVNQLAYLEPSIVRDGREFALSLIKSDGKGPQIQEEQLVSNASGSLYDFIRRVESIRRRYRVDDTIARFSLLESLRTFCGSYRGDWFSRFRSFIRSLPVELVDEFNREWLQKETGGQRLYIEASLHVPVVCVDAMLFVTPCSPRGQIRNFLQTNMLMTGIRHRSWPGMQINPQIGRRRPEALTIICNVAGVPPVLASCLNWYVEMLETLKKTEPIVIQRSILEGALFKSAVAATNSKERSRRLRRKR